MWTGFLTNSLVEEAKRHNSSRFQALDSVAEWAVSHGFTDLECGPSLPLDEEAYGRVLGEGKISITALIYCRNYLSTDEEEAREHLEQLRQRIEFAGRLGIEKVITSTGIDKRVEEGLYDRDPAVKQGQPDTPYPGAQPGRCCGAVCAGGGAGGEKRCEALL